MKNVKFLLKTGTIALLFSIISASCTEKEFDPNDPAGSFVIAKEPYDDKNYESAVQKLGEFKSRFPYSKFTSQAELLIANAQFELERYEEAANSYSQFVKLHPKHEQVDFAMYRVGESYWSDSPEAIDRDQEYTVKAMEEWGQLIAKFPDNKYSTQAAQKVAEGRRRLALSSEFVANFYCKMKKYHACAYRFTDLLENYPMFVDLHANALNKAADAFDKLAKAKTQDPESDKNIYFKQYSAAELTAKATELRKRLQTQK